MRTTAILGLALCLMASANAQWGKRVKGNGNMTTQERATGDYDGVAVGGFFDVDLVAGTEGKVTVKAEENLQEYIITEVKNGILHIRVENGVNIKPSSWKDGIHVTVPVEAIESLSLAGSGDVNCETVLKASKFSADVAGSGDLKFRVDADELNASMAGSGDMKISGKAGNFEVDIAGSGDIDAFDLEARSVDASISGSADLHVTASEFIKARVSGSGDIRYRGNPTKIDSKVSGSGEISKG
jgi:hypothetical protein